MDSLGGEIGGKTEEDVEILTPRLRTYNGDGSWGNITATIHDQSEWERLQRMWLSGYLNDVGLSPMCIPQCDMMSPIDSPVKNLVNADSILCRYNQGLWSSQVLRRVCIEIFSAHDLVTQSSRPLGNPSASQSHYGREARTTVEGDLNVQERLEELQNAQTTLHIVYTLELWICSIFAICMLILHRTHPIPFPSTRSTTKLAQH